MSQTQMISQLKNRVATLQSALSDKQHQLQQLRDIQTQADSKIKAMTKIHNDKVKSLLNSLQILKKQKAQLQGLSKEHKRSKLIEQLNKEILDQDIVIEVLRKYIYDDKGRDKGRQICDQMVIKALTKGPERVRAITREELRMEIDKLKAINIGLEGKSKLNNNGRVGRQKQDGNASESSQLSEQSFVNQNQQIYSKLRDFQNQNQSLKLQLSTKGRIIQKLKSQIKQKDRLKAQVQLLTNQLEVSSRKVFALQQLLRQTKENMNAKIAQLYERQLKVEELQLNSRENGQRLKQAHQTNNIILQEVRQEKQQLIVQIDLLKKENESLMLQNITMKKRQEEQKNKIFEIRQMNVKNKEELSQKLKQYEIQIGKVVAENSNLTTLVRQAENNLFKQRAQWVEERTKLIEDLQKQQQLNNQQQIQKNATEELLKLRKQNHDLKQIMQSGSGASSNNKILLQRLENYRIRLQFYESKQKGGKGKERQLYEQIFSKYNSLLNDFEQYKRQAPTVKPKAKKLNIVQVTRKQQQKIKDLNSSISQLGLSEINSSVLDNFDSSYEYELRVNDFDSKKVKGVPKISEEDKQLLKLINSNLWDFVKDDRMDIKIEQAINVAQKQQAQEQQQLSKRIRQIKNLSHPQGKKLIVYDSEIKEIQGLSDSVSVTSALQRDIDKYDSDVDIEVKRTIKGSPAINMRNLGALSDSFNSSLNVSSAKSGDSSFTKRKKGEKASVIKIQKEGSLASSVMGSSIDKDMNSSVSSVGIKQSMLVDIDSDISVDFRKKKGKK